MTRSAAFSLFFLALAANAASLQDSTFTSAYYTTLYAGGLINGRNDLNGMNNEGVAVGEYENFDSRNMPRHAQIYSNF